MVLSICYPQKRINQWAENMVQMQNHAKTTSLHFAFCGLLFHEVLCMALWGGRVTMSMAHFISFLIKDVMSSSIS